MSWCDPNAPPPGFIFAFNYPIWAALFPELGDVPSTQVQLYFNLACGYVDNTTSSIIQDPNDRANLLNLATAHLTKLMASRTVNGVVQPPSDLVGRISQAGEGSVNVSTEYKTPTSASEAWWDQTQYGAQAWVILSKYQMMLYRVSPFSSAFRSPFRRWGRFGGGGW